MRPYFYPRSPYGERLNPQFTANQIQIISIHALLTESDDAYAPVCAALTVFLSTLSLRRATFRLRRLCAVQLISIHALLTESDQYQHNGGRRWIHFYPRSPYGERRFESPICEVLLDISIHALLTESDWFAQY